MPKPHLVFLFSDTGGGHRSAVEAITEAMALEYPGAFTWEMVDIFKEYAPLPLRYAPEIYPTLSRMPTMWAAGYRASDGPYRKQMLFSALWPYLRRSLARLVRDHPCDLLVSVHPLSNGTVLRSIRKNPTPFVTVVTDMVSTHAFWFDERADLVMVPTEVARQRGINLGLKPERVVVTGMPVAEKFAQIQSSKAELRQKLGWEGNLPVALMVGGGEGMGPLGASAKAIDKAGLPVRVAVVCGRNRHLLHELEIHKWRIPHDIYGFLTDMPERMLAADVLVSKAGPGTISEGFIAGLPIILYSRMPGQEEGNVDYVVNEQAGIWAPESELVVAALQRWLSHPEERERTALNSARLAKPHASREIARLLGAKAGIGR